MFDKIMLFTALILSLAAVAVSGLAIRESQKSGIQGVCVSYDVNTVGTMVERVTIVDGTPMCQTGSFVSINPGKVSQ